MNQNYNEMPNGYLESINKGIQTVRAFSGHMTRGKGTQEERIQRLIEELSNADAIVIGAGAGLSTSAGLTYSGERFDKYFGDFAAKYSIRDMKTEKLISLLFRREYHPALCPIARSAESR